MRGASVAVSGAITCAAVFCVGVSGCASLVISDEEVSELPLAFVYFDAETSRHRAEQIARAMEEERTPATSSRGSSTARVVADVEKIAEYLQRSLGAERGSGERFPGRLALLDPRTREVTLVEGARKGAVPQDWSPDRERLLFTQVVHGEIPQLFELNVTTGDVGRLTRGRDAHPEGCYGPDGSVVYTSVDPSAAQRNSRIMIADPRGGAPEPVSQGEYAYYPTCAPDGSAVAYTEVGAGGRSQRVVIRSPIRTGEPRVLSPGKEPSFSADGRWIVFSAKRKGKWAIWRISPDGTGRTGLGRGGFDERRPSLSPENRLVVYVADTIQHQRLFLRRIDGSGDRIFFSGGDGDRPVW
jgi:Tol biopolymer transport system component